VSGYLLGLDLGTSSVKAVLGTREHGVVAIAERSYPMHRPKPGWAEHHPEDWIRAVAAAIREVSAKAGRGPGSISAVCIVGQRDVAALVDRDGHSLCPCIHWTDRRDPAETEELFGRIGRERLFATSGTVPIPGLVLPNLVWARRHAPEIWGSVFAALQPKDYIAHRLTGEVATDRTSPTRSLLNDWRTEDWCEETCADAGVPRSILPEVRYDPWDIRATLDRRAEQIGLAAGTLLVAGGGDDPSARSDVVSSSPAR
jgi:xylulokinase